MNNNSKYEPPRRGMDCPNGCYERLWKQGIADNRVEGVAPAMAWPTGTVYTSLSIKLWCSRLSRHARQARGRFSPLPFTHCPHCGAKLAPTAPD